MQLFLFGNYRIFYKGRSGGFQCFEKIREILFLKDEIEEYSEEFEKVLIV